MNVDFENKYGQNIIKSVRTHLIVNPNVDDATKMQILKKVIEEGPY